tara:strand:- start:2562 stop:3341 length:780 start_codon:yes stop_codon:yes gene_type:complete
MLSSIFKPKFTKNLIRIGQKLDGGYVINQEILKKTKILLTFGLSDEFSFEKDFKKRNKNINIFAYDHTVNIFFWTQHFIKWFFHFIKNQSNFRRIFYFIDYFFFFSQNNVKHIKKKIVPNGFEDNQSTSLTKIFNEKNFDKSQVLLKVDIEKDEYKILNEICNLDILCLIIEFSDFDKNIDIIKNFILKTNLKIIHLHANNFGYVNSKGYPEHLEITFGNPKYIEIDEKKIDFTKYPVHGLDYPNDTKKKDISISFKDF